MLGLGLQLCGARYRLQDLTDGRKALQQVKHIARPVGWFCSWLYPPCLKLTPAKDSSERHICRPNTKKERKCAFLTSSFAALACGRSSRLNKSVDSETFWAFVNIKDNHVQSFSYRWWKLRPKGPGFNSSTMGGAAISSLSCPRSAQLLTLVYVIFSGVQKGCNDNLKAIRFFVFDQWQMGTGYLL